MGFRRLISRSRYLQAEDRRISHSSCLDYGIEEWKSTSAAPNQIRHANGITSLLHGLLLQKWKDKKTAQEKTLFHCLLYRTEIL